MTRRFPLSTWRVAVIAILGLVAGALPTAAQLAPGGGSSGGGGAGGAVTNAGTFAVQNTAPTPAGTNIIGKTGIDQTTPGTTNGVVVNSSALPAGAATAAAQTSELAAVSNRTTYLASSSTSLAASGTLNDTNYLPPGGLSSPSPYAYVVGTFLSNQSGTYNLQVTDSNGIYTMQTAALAANTLVTVRLPLAITGGTSVRYRAWILNGSTAATLATASIALTTN